MTRLSTGPAPTARAPVEPAAAEPVPAELARAEARRWLLPAHPVGTCSDEGAGSIAAQPGGDGVRLREPAWGWDIGGLPTGTLAVAAGRALAVAALAGDRAGVVLEVDAEAVAATVLLPLVVASATGTPPAARPPDPLPTGDGAVCADLGADGDREAFERLLGVLGPGPWPAETLAARAQEWRLPVTPYRARPPVGASGAVRTPPAATGAGPAATGGGRARRGPKEHHAHRRPPGATGWPPLAGLTIVDLTAMWSGPLCTALLASLGARVVKVEPACRPDGTRASPGGRLFQALNGAKEVAPLDLRRPGDRAEFFALVAGSDLVVDNFSPRVAPNLGIDPPALRRVAPDILTLSLPAFPPGPERHWVSYGTGVHAVSGLGQLAPDTKGAFAPPVVTYPDPLAGLAGAAAALALVARRDRGGGPGHAEVPLLTALRPLVTVADRGSLGRPLTPGLVTHLAGRFGPVPPAPFFPPGPIGRSAATASATTQGADRGR